VEGAAAAKLRDATAADEKAIRELVLGAKLNPRNLDPSRFVVAEVGDGIAGAAQLRRHSDGALELASIVVRDDLRGAGVASAMVDRLLTGEEAEVFVLVDRPYREHFGRWGFEEVPPATLPRSVKLNYRIGRVVTTIGSVVQRRRIRIVPLRRPA
jgi:N-acetylglutamate synthase-like GNAT family acetyltransferase